MTTMTLLKRWQEVFPEGDWDLYQKGQRTQTRQPYGTRPALLIVDGFRSSVGSRPIPLIEADNDYNSRRSEVAWITVENIKKLLEACRTRHIPPISTTMDTVTREFSTTRPRWSKATVTDASRQALLEGYKFVEEIAPLDSELVIRSKTKPSAFFETPLRACLQTMGIDCLLIAGFSTSGCVRATVLDAMSSGFPCFVVEECVFDRYELCHLVSLFSMNQKYADVITLEEALDYVTRVEVQTESYAQKV